ncbi:9461_t:CDS:2 [Funneliformis caledonium]|nr:9461_t:CDS:2 [Funneliformis caledonium]
MSKNLKTVPDNVIEYQNKEYWEERYSKLESHETFDWFNKTYKELKPLFDIYLPDKNVSILMLGCGNSTLSEDMYDVGYHHITNVDFSETVIENMRFRCKDRTEMSWIVMDVRDLTFQDETFDAVIDKGDVWNPKPEIVENVKKVVDEVVR